MGGLISFLYFLLIAFEGGFIIECYIEGDEMSKEWKIMEKEDY